MKAGDVLYFRNDEVERKIIFIDDKGALLENENGCRFWVDYDFLKLYHPVPVKHKIYINVWKRTDDILDYGAAHKSKEAAESVLISMSQPPYKTLEFEWEE